MKVCLICPPDRSKKEEDFEYCFSAYNIPNLGVGYIASVLEANGIDVDVIECLGEGIKLSKLYEILQEKEYDMIGISSYDYNSFNIFKVVNKIKTLLPNSFVFLGGYFATLCHELILNNFENVDCCVLGEGEYTCLELVNTVKDGGDIRSIPGIAYREGKEIKKSSPRKLISNLDELPFPKRKFASKKGLSSLITSRGCYGNCIYCSIKAFYKYSPGEVIRYRKSEYVVAEIEYLVNELKATHINIYDDNFLVSSTKNRERIIELCNLLKEKKLSFKFAITVKASDVEPNIDILKMLKEVGLECVFVGVESFVERQLQFFNKKTSVTENIRSLQILADLGLKIDIGLIMLDPFTNLEEILTNLNTIKEIKYFESMYEGSFLISMYYPLRPVYGSPVHNLLDEKGMLRNNEDGYNFGCPDVELFNKVLKAWLKKIYPVNLRYYLAFKAKELNQHELANELRQEKIKLAYLDVDFQIKLCNMIKSGEVSEENYEDLIQEWEHKLDPILNKFLEARKFLNGVGREAK